MDSIYYSCRIKYLLCLTDHLKGSWAAFSSGMANRFYLKSKLWLTGGSYQGSFAEKGRVENECTLRGKEQ